MRYLLFISGLILEMACSSAYKGLQRTDGNVNCIQQFKPRFGSAQYRAQVDVTGKHISGILLIKTMNDSSTRLVFSNEMGFKFFDFGFSPDSGFKVYYVIKQMDKKVVIQTLRKDFELVLMTHIKAEKAYLLKGEKQSYYAFPQGKGINYYITDPDCTRLLGMQRASKRKPVVEAVMEHYSRGMPDTIGISHKNFNFDIALKRIDK
jgi:hypothetical protein